MLPSAGDEAETSTPSSDPREQTDKEFVVFMQHKNQTKLCFCRLLTLHSSFFISYFQYTTAGLRETILKEKICRELESELRARETVKDRDGRTSCDALREERRRSDKNVTFRAETKFISLLLVVSHLQSVCPYYPQQCLFLQSTRFQLCVTTMICINNQ